MTSPLQRLRRSSRTKGRAPSPARPVSAPGDGFVSTLVEGRPRVRANLRALAEMRTEEAEQTAERLLVNLLRTAPHGFDGYPVDFRDLEIAECGFEAGHPWLRTRHGRVFYDWPASARDVLMYVLMRDRLPVELNVETLGVAANVLRRYVQGTGNVPDGVRVAVDAGCYIGFKPIAYADLVGPEGKVVAIEMMPDNYELLRRNVEANDLTERIATVNCALSDRPGSVTARRFRKQAATIADVDQLAGFGDERTVEMETLARVFDRTLGDRDVDFLNVQVNGNELATLEGLGDWRSRVHSFSVTSPYTRKGERVRDQVVKWFRTHDIEVTEVGETYVWARRR